MKVALNQAILYGLLIAGLVIFALSHWMHVYIWLPYAFVLAGLIGLLSRRPSRP